jgi:hypothetical protein
MAIPNTITIESISVGNDPYLGRQPGAPSKYEPLFASLRPGMCLRTPSDAAPAISAALDKYIQRQGTKNVSVRFVTKYPGAKKGQEGRVWLLPKEEPAQTGTKKLKEVK